MTNIPPSPDPLNVPPFKGRTPSEEAEDKVKGIRGTMVIDGRTIKVKDTDDLEEVVKRERNRNR